MGIDSEEFQDAEDELKEIVEDPSVLEEKYTDVTKKLNEEPDQLIWSYIYRNISGSLRRELTNNPPSSFPTWLKELFREEYTRLVDGLPADKSINQALEYLVRRRKTA